MSRARCWAAWPKVCRPLPSASAWRPKEVLPTPELTAVRLCQDAGLDEKACEGAPPDQPVRAWVEQLARNGQQRETVAALAQLLPARNAVAWALGVIRRIVPPAAGT